MKQAYIDKLLEIEESQQADIFDYLGLILEMHNKMLEYACG